MVVISLLAILMAMAAPSFQQMRRNTQVSALANEFVVGAAFARAQAISRNQCVTLCMAADLSADAPVCASGGSEWNGGWLIFANAKCDDKAADASAELLKVYMGDPDGASLQSAAGAGALRSLRFNARGMSSLSATASMVVAAPGGSDPAKVVCLDRAGRARVAQADGLQCGADAN